MRKLSDNEQLAWVAGFMDGESCVSINRQKVNRTTKAGGAVTYFGYSLGIAISQKKPEPLEIIHRLFGGHFFSYKSRGVTYWRWQHWGPGALACLEQVYPYLVVKREIAGVCMQFQEEMTNWNREFGRNGYPEWIIKAREEFWMKARVLNAKSWSDPSSPKYEGPQEASKKGQSKAKGAKIQQKGELATTSALVQ